MSEEDLREQLAQVSGELEAINLERVSINLQMTLEITRLVGEQVRLQEEIRMTREQLRKAYPKIKVTI